MIKNIISVILLFLSLTSFLLLPLGILKSKDEKQAIHALNFGLWGTIFLILRCMLCNPHKILLFFLLIIILITSPFSSQLWIKFFINQNEKR